MTDLNLWDSVLGEEEVVNWTRCGADQGGNIIHWGRGNLDTERKVMTWTNSSLEMIKLETTKMLREDVCPSLTPKMKKKLKTFQVSRDYQGNIDFCHNIGGKFVVARDNKTLTEILSAMSELEDM